MNYEQKIIKQALQGSEDYHALMRSIIVSSLKGKAGYIPQKTDTPPPIKNYVHWQSTASDMSVGNWWIFYAMEQKFAPPAQIKRIWRYGQALKIGNQYLSSALLRKYTTPEERNFVREQIRDMSDLFSEEDGLIELSGIYQEFCEYYVGFKESEIFAGEQYYMSEFLYDLVINLATWVFQGAAIYLREITSNYQHLHESYRP